MKKILYVEDNEDNVYMLTRRLKKKGFEIVVATDGEMGVEMASSDKPDLILMDLSLPKMDGWTATKTIKSKNGTERIESITEHIVRSKNDCQSVEKVGFSFLIFFFENRTTFGVSMCFRERERERVEIFIQI